MGHQSENGIPERVTQAITRDLANERIPDAPSTSLWRRWRQGGYNTQTVQDIMPEPEAGATETDRPELLKKLKMSRYLTYRFHLNY